MFEGDVRVSLRIRNTVTYKVESIIMLRVAWLLVICRSSMVAAWCPQSNPCCIGTNPPSWDAWSYWSDCYPDCGYGTRERSRYCLPASECPDCTAYYDCTCNGSDHQIESCFTPKNPASWGYWGEWGNCLASCGFGFRHRYRDCEPADYCPDCYSYDDCYCPGASFEEKECYTHQKPPSWSNWGEWGDCDPECLYGNKHRYRDCEPDTYCSDCTGADCKCPGDDSEDMECFNPLNPPVWGEWSRWGDCSESCNRGERSRHRDCVPVDVCPDCSYDCECYSGAYSEYETCEPNCDTIFINNEFVNLAVTATSNANFSSDALYGTGSHWYPRRNNIAYWRAFIPKESCCQTVSISFEFRYSSGVLVSEKLFGEKYFASVMNIPSPPNEPDNDWKQSGIVFFSEEVRKIELEVSPSSVRGPQPCLRNVNITTCCPSECISDIAFVIDGSGSLAFNIPNYWDDILNFVTSLVDQFSIGPTRVAVVQFGDFANAEILLDQFDDPDSLTEEIKGIKAFYGGTNISAALAVVRQEVFIATNGDRPSVSNIVILITDGHTEDEELAIAEADIFKIDGTIIVIGLSYVNTDLLNDIASDPIDKNVFTGADVDEITEKLDEIVETICNQ